MATPICIGGSLDRSGTSHRCRYCFVDLDEWIDNGGKIPDFNIKATGTSWNAFSLAGISLILIWQ